MWDVAVTTEQNSFQESTVQSFQRFSARDFSSFVTLPVENVLASAPEGWQPDHTIDFAGFGVRLENGGCFVPFVSSRVKIGDRVSFRIEARGEWGERFSGGGLILSTNRMVSGVQGVVIHFLYLDQQCRDSVLFSCTQGTLF